MKKQSEEFTNFDNVMSGLLAVPYSELQKKLEEEKRDKAKRKRAPNTKTARAKPKKQKGPTLLG